MDALVLVATLAAAVLGLFWLVQRLLPPNLNPKLERAKATPETISTESPAKRTIWAVIALGGVPLWINSLDKMLLAEKWSFPFCYNLFFVVLLPISIVACLFRAINGFPLAQPLLVPEHSSGNSPPSIDASTESEIVAAIKSGEKIEAVKLYQQASGSGLKEAKEYVEQLQIKMEAS